MDARRNLDGNQIPAQASICSPSSLCRRGRLFLLLTASGSTAKASAPQPAWGPSLPLEVDGQRRRGEKPARPQLGLSFQIRQRSFQICQGSFSCNRHDGAVFGSGLKLSPCPRPRVLLTVQGLLPGMGSGLAVPMQLLLQSNDLKVPLCTAVFEFIKCIPFHFPPTEGVRTYCLNPISSEKREYHCLMDPGTARVHHDTARTRKDLPLPDEGC